MRRMIAPVPRPAMRPLLAPLLALALVPLLGGCVVHTAYDVATLPVRAGSKVVDWSTTSRSEADRNLGRKVRKQRERDAKEAKKQAKEAKREGQPPPQ